MILNKDQYGQIEVAGEAILPVIRGISGEALSKALLAKYSLNDVQPGQFYPITSYLGLLYDIEKKMPLVLKRIGEFMSREAILPPNLTSFDQFLSMMDQAYYMNHRGYQEEEIGHYRFEKQSDEVFQMTVSIPYPCVFDQGIFHGFAKKFGMTISLDHADDACRSKGDPQCTYRIHLKG
jgi:predicted hydrocarbon binding protein